MGSIRAYRLGVRMAVAPHLTAQAAAAGFAHAAHHRGRCRGCAGMTELVRIRKIVESDQGNWARLREALWPGSPADHDEETRSYFDRRLETPVVFVAETEGR